MAGNNDTIEMQVPAKLKAAEAPALKTLLADKRGRPVSMEFAQVTQVGTQCIQVLIAANRAWKADGVPFEIKNMSGEIRDSLLICGLNPSDVGAKEANHDS